MKSWQMIATVALMSLLPLQASALVIDTNPTWDNSVNIGWDGSGQSLTVDATENHFQSIGFYFDQESYGRTFGFRLSDAQNGGATLFSTSFVVVAGSNTININQTLTPGSTVFALLDYQGFSGRTAHFSYTDGYAGGNSVFLEGGTYQTYAGLDHRFIAEFSGGQIPEPATLALLGLGLAGFGLTRRRQA